MDQKLYSQGANWLAFHKYINWGIIKHTNTLLFHYASFYALNILIGNLNVPKY